MTFQEIKIKIQKGNAIDLRNVINDSFDLFKKSWVQGLIMFLFVFLLIIVVEVIFIVPVMLLKLFPSTMDLNSIQNHTLFMILLFFLFFIFLFILVGTIMTGFVGGLYIIYKKIDHNETYAISDFFTLLKGQYLAKTFMVGFAQVFLIMIFYMMCCLPVIYVTIPVSYITVIYAFNKDFSTIDIVKLSFAIGNKNWIEKFLLRMIMGFFAMILGMVLCGIGLIATFALTLIPQYFVYKNLVGFNQDSEINSIGLSEDVYIE